MGEINGTNCNKNLKFHVKHCKNNENILLVNLILFDVIFILSLFFLGSFRGVPDAPLLLHVKHTKYTLLKKTNYGKE